MVSWSRESLQPEEILVGSTTGELQTRNTVAVSIEDEISVADGLVRIIPSGRYETYTDRTSPFLTVRADLERYYRGMAAERVKHVVKTGTLAGVISPGAGFRIKANYGRYHRIPSLMELFGHRGMVLPNPHLEPEAGLNRDVGIQWDRDLGGAGFLSAEIVYFWSDVRDLIMFTQVPWARSAQAVNINSADIDGQELSLSVGTWRGFTLSGNLTRLRAIDTGPVAYTNGKHLPNRPGLEGLARLTWTTGGISVFYEFDYVSGNYWNAYNGVAPNNKGPLFPIRRLHSAGVTVPTGLDAACLTVEVRNLADQQLEDVMGYPLPGRTTFATMVVDL
jgi:iron complex outermembrane receptor protein